METQAQSLRQPRRKFSEHPKYIFKLASPCHKWAVALVPLLGSLRLWRLIRSHGTSVCTVIDGAMLSDNRPWKTFPYFRLWMLSSSDERHDIHARQGRGPDSTVYISNYPRNGYRACRTTVLTMAFFSSPVSCNETLTSLHCHVV
jgi:hypothetical protein